MKHLKVISVAVLSSLLASTVAADPLDDAIALFRRQSVNLSTGVTSDTTSSAPQTTSSAPPSQTSSIASTSSVPASSTTTEFSTSTRSQEPTSASSSAEESSAPSSTSSIASTTRVPTSITSQVLVTFTTVTNGQTSVGTHTTSSVIPTSTDVDSSSLAGGKSSGGSSGLSSTDKSIIGGVVGGVGGALLLAGLGYTAWRIWGKNRHLHDEDAYDPNMVGQDKLSSSTGDNASANSPFNRTLDQYHQPGPVNQASNF